MIPYDVIIVGAGPAGLFTAIHAAEKLDRVLILEKQPDPGRKLLLTGSGQCNFTNIRPIREFPQGLWRSWAFSETGPLSFYQPGYHCLFQAARGGSHGGGRERQGISRIPPGTGRSERLTVRVQETSRWRSDSGKGSPASKPLADRRFTGTFSGPVCMNPETWS